MKKCPFCHDQELQSVPNKASLHRCPECRRRFYLTVCWSCHAVIFKQDIKKNHCPACNWYQCDNCHSCSRGCVEAVDPMTGQDDYSSDWPSDFPVDEVTETFNEAQGNYACADGAEPPAEDPDDVRLENEIPNACWTQWSEDDPSAYAE